MKASNLFYPILLIFFIALVVVGCFGGSEDSKKNSLCGDKKYCYEMSSCEEACFYYEDCGLLRLDGDKDGIPCESLCHFPCNQINNTSNVENTSDTQIDSTINGNFESCIISRIIDGDTIETSNGDIHRLIGIDTPEKFYSNKLELEAEKCGVTIGDIINLGELASSYLLSILPEGVSCEYVKYGVDEYGRILSEIFFDNKDINEEMVKEGYACVFYSKELSDDKIEKLENLMYDAYNNARGLFGLAPDLMKCLCCFND